MSPLLPNVVGACGLPINEAALLDTGKYSVSMLAWRSPTDVADCFALLKDGLTAALTGADRFRPVQAAARAMAWSILPRN